MLCKKCNYDNETTQAYCRLCGARLTYTAGRAEGALLDKMTNTSATSMEEELRKFLVASICIFLLLGTLKVMFGRGNWADVYLVPSASVTAEHARVDFIHDPADIPQEKLPMPK